VTSFATAVCAMTVHICQIAVSIRSRVRLIRGGAYCTNLVEPWLAAGEQRRPQSLVLHTSDPDSSARPSSIACHCRAEIRDRQVENYQ
jgi:hypothetical protein